MILVDTDIRDTVGQGAIGIEPFEDAQVQPASYDLRVGPAGISTKSAGKVDVEARGYFELHRGDFGILLTREIIRFDSHHTARIGLRSKYARKGIVATTGPQVDPGFRGRLKIGVTNLSPHVVSFPFEDDFITLELHRLKRAAEKPYDGPYQDIEDLSPDDIEVVTEGDNIGFAKMIDSLRALSANVGELSETVNDFVAQNKATQLHIKFIGWGIGVIFVALALQIALVSLK